LRDETLTITIEQHDHTATLYAAGVLGISSALRLVRVCEQLPPVIRVARIDLRAVYGLEAGALTVLESRLRHWRSKHGRIHLTMPASINVAPSEEFRTSGK
jgi:ABC-type transporter Mla MlaB component